MFKTFKIKNFIKLFVLLFISAMIISCSTTLEFKRKPIYSGPILPKSKVAMLIDCHFQFFIKSSSDTYTSYTAPYPCRPDGYIHSIDDVIINVDYKDYQDKFDLSNKVSYDLLPGKHKVIVRAVPDPIGSDRAPGYYTTVEADKEAPAVEFYAKPGILYCSRLKVNEGPISYKPGVFYGKNPDTIELKLEADVVPCSFMTEDLFSNPFIIKFIPEQ